MELMLSKGQALPQDLAIITRTEALRGEATWGPRRKSRGFHMIYGDL
jgi:hypothetical protein